MIDMLTPDRSFGMRSFRCSGFVGFGIETPYNIQLILGTSFLVCTHSYPLLFPRDCILYPDMFNS